MARFDLSDKEWAIIAPLLPVDGRGPKRRDDRTVLNGIFYILRTGAPWRDLPEDMAHLRQSIIVMSAGESAVYGARYSRHWHQNMKMPLSLSTVRL